MPSLAPRRPLCRDGRLPPPLGTSFCGACAALFIAAARPQTTSETAPSGCKPGSRRLDRRRTPSPAQWTRCPHIIPDPRQNAAGHSTSSAFLVNLLAKADRNLVLRLPYGGLADRAITRPGGRRQLPRIGSFAARRD